MEKETIEGLIGQYGWMAAVAFFFLIGRNTIESLIEAIKAVSYTHLTLPTTPYV